ncbi:hypothetical protein AVEN_256600-1 [Araneus ventricosus]|uniref:Uncharacterized protein n=1 Tax=Araneus ventricosus TaxID=182803 RepID=A0A4Y2S2Z1_ARAVE|nr:hypothetical protein AVEN_256600-1 [Araneus ventricosus]
MHRARGVTHEEILKELQRIDEIDLGDSEISDFDRDEEYVLPETNNSDDESEISSHHDSDCHESNSSDNECSETNLQASINSRHKHGRGSTRMFLAALVENVA